MRSKRYVWGGGALLALAVLFVGLTILFGHLFRGWRLDLTQNGLYTTAPGTEHILKNLKEPVNLYFFYSEKLAGQLSPDLKTYGTRVRELLDEMVARSTASCTSRSSIRSRSPKMKTVRMSSACAERLQVTRGRTCTSASPARTRPTASRRSSSSIRAKKSS